MCNRHRSYLLLVARLEREQRGDVEHDLKIVDGRENRVCPRRVRWQHRPTNCKGQGSGGPECQNAASFKSPHQTPSSPGLASFWAFGKQRTGDVEASSEPLPALKTHAFAQHVEEPLKRGRARLVACMRGRAQRPSTPSAVWWSGRSTRPDPTQSRTGRVQNMSSSTAWSSRA